MYWLTWHYHVKDIAGAPYKFRQIKTNKRTEVLTVSSRGQTTVTLQYNHDRLVIVKRRPEKYSLQLAMERCQRRCIPDRWRQAVPRTCRSHWEGTVTECWTCGGRYDQHGWVSRAQMASSINMMSGEGSQQGRSALFHEDSGRPERTAGMWLAPELATNGVHEATGLCVLIASLRKPNGRRIQDGLQLVLQLARDTSKNRVAVIHLADNLMMIISNYHCMAGSVLYCPPI